MSTLRIRLQSCLSVLWWVLTALIPSIAAEGSGPSYETNSLPRETKGPVFIITY